MSYVITIIVFVLVFSILILIHELGHFLMAKRAGIEVQEFGFGLPPRIWGKKKGKTIYSINWIPFGGFVKMLGEDATDPTMLKKKTSFIAQPMRARVLVIVAGVVMNFFLAWLLLVVGFSAGMQPLLAPEDVLPAVSDGVIHLEEGLKINNVEEGSFAEKVGFKSEDIIISHDEQLPDESLLNEIQLNPVGVYKIYRDGGILSYEVLPEHVEQYLKDGDSFGLSFYEFVSFPRIRVFEVDRASKSYKAGLRKGDFILSVNGEQIYSVESFEEVVRGEDVLQYEVYRNGIHDEIIAELKKTREVIISNVVPGSPAAEVGLQDGDVILSVNGSGISDSEELIAYVSEHADETLAYLIERDGKELFYEINPKEGRIGVYLSELMSYGSGQELSLYNVSLLSSVVAVDNVKYPFHVSLYKAFGEGFRLSKLTAKMFVGVVSQLVRDGNVPETVAGPVGIARLTHVFVQEGFVPLLRFVAILSLSLAVINILPFPALDGGRLLFIIIELIIGRRVNQKWESYIHAFGYFLILLLILAITYSDITKLINGIA